jgi:hypothetical protein
MKKAILLFFTVIGFCCRAHAQDSFITYNSEAEKTLINSAQTPDDYIKLAIASELGETETNIVYNKFLQDIKQLKLESIDGEKAGKRAAKIYDVVRSFFLKDYEHNTKFVDLLVNGKYDCLDASILYAFVLEKLNIPYQITQYPANVFVVAYPGTANIQFNTVDLTKGIYVFTADSKQQDIIGLIKGKYIDQSYVERVGVDEAFNEFFYGKEHITFKEAVGMLYFERAMMELRTDKSTDAYSDFCKSDMLFPDKKNDYFKNTLMTNMAYNFTYDDLKDWQALMGLVNNDNVSADVKKFVQFKFDDILNTKLLKEGQKAKVDEIYNYLHSNLADTAIRKKIDEDYLSENANYSYITSNYPQALDYIEKDYILDTNNPIVTSQFVQLIRQNFTGSNGSEQNINLLNKYTTRYPALLKNPEISASYIYNISYLAYFAFVREDGAAGEKYMKMMIHALDTYPNHSDAYNMQIANVFGKASEYYFRKQGKRKCLEVINAGLKYVPDSDILLRKLKVNSQ